MTLQALISKSPGINLTRVKVKLPKDIVASMKAFSNAKSTMWIAGNIMGEFMLSPDNPDEKSRKLVPFPENTQPSCLLSCEVVKVLKT